MPTFMPLTETQTRPWNRPWAGVRGRGAAGVTLIELLVVIAIIGLALALVPPLLANALPGFQERSAARDLATSLRRARQAAIAEHRTTVLRVDVGTRQYAVPGRGPARSLPPGLGLEVFVGDVLVDGGSGGIAFFPDGSSTGGRIALLGPTREYRVDVDWLTGRVRLDER
jgi:general secretion pathway protein H